MSEELTAVKQVCCCQKKLSIAVTVKDPLCAGRNCTTIIHPISLHFNSHFPGGPGLADTKITILDFIGAKDDGGGGGNCSYKTLQSSSQIVITNKPKPSSLQARCHLTNSVRAHRIKAVKYTFIYKHGPLYVRFNGHFSR